MNSIHATVQFAKPEPKPKEYDLNTCLLLNFDEDFQDTSIYKWKVITQTQPVISTDIKKFGSGSLYLNGSSNIYISDRLFPNFNGVNYTFEFWLYRTSNFTTNKTECIFAKTSASYGTGGAFGIIGGHVSSSSDKLDYVLASEQILSAPSTSLMLNQWNHIAFCRSAVNYYCFINGVKVYSYTLNNSKSGYFFTMPNTPFVIGSNLYNGTSFFNGYLDEFRVSNICRYTDNFTPPTEPFSPYLEG